MGSECRFLKDKNETYCMAETLLIRTENLGVSSMSTLIHSVVLKRLNFAKHHQKFKNVSILSALSSLFDGHLLHFYGHF